MNSNLSAVILAAGQGTRMKSALPKVLHRVLGRTLVGHLVEAARAAGATSVVVVVGHGREEVEATLSAEHGGDDLHFVVQAEQKGTGHAAMQAQPVIGDAPGLTLVLPGDVPNLSAETLTRFVNVGRKARAKVALMSSVVDDPTGYGRIVRDGDDEVLRNVEHKDAYGEELDICEINSGVYLFDNTFLWANIDKIGAVNAQGEYYLPDMIGLAVAVGEGVEGFIVESDEETWGVNTRRQLAAAETYGRLRRNDALMLAGVTMIDPAGTYVDAGVEVARDVTLAPGVRLMGETVIGAGCVIRQGSVIESSVLEPGVLIKPYCHLESAVVRTGAQIGPFAHLRPGADIGPDARIGNFVEVKKSVLGRGSKANHLAYIGDADIGEGCNIGAGTITCNYDGFNKNRTVLEDGVFTGSNSALVAPLRLGAGAYVAAGSVITEDVTPDALAVGRGRQREIPGWAKRFRDMMKKRKQDKKST